MKQHALTIILPLDSAQVTAVDARLTTFGQNVAKQPILPFDSLDLMHFASWVVFQSDQFGPQLVFEANFDGEPGEFLAQLTANRAGLDQIFAGCLDYPTGGTAADVSRYLLAHAVHTDTFYVGCVGLSRRRIEQEALLRDRIEVFLDSMPRAGLTAREIREKIQAFVKADANLAWTLTPADPPTLAQRVPLWAIKAAAFALVALVLGAVFLASSWTGLFAFIGLVAIGLALFAIVLRRHEKSDAAATATIPQLGNVQRLVRREDHRAQNHLASVTTVKPGWFRFVLLKTILAVINLGARFIYNKGNLGGIPSIHFGRWAVINGGRQLLFLSNFDGSWEHYLGEFIDQAAGGLTAVWSNAAGFPAARWLVEDGARDEQRFKAFARDSQTYSQLWYSAYPYLTIQNILNNKEIRAQLWGDLDDGQLHAWLRRF